MQKDSKSKLLKYKGMKYAPGTNVKQTIIKIIIEQIR